MRATCKIISLTLLMCVCAAGTCAAIEAAAVAGNTFTCFFITQPDVIRTDVAFSEKGAVVFVNYEGNGFYSTLTQYFIGSYWTLNQTLGAKKGDLLFFFIGRLNDPFLIGTGVVIMEYSDVYPMVFFGVRTVDE